MKKILSKYIGMVKQIKRSSKGFSLIELSIVLIIVGLLTASIYGAAVLVERAKVTTVTSEMQNIRLASSAFQDRYGELPGDGNKFVDKIEAITQGGNSDGWIGSDDYTDLESALFFNHVSKTGFMQGDFTGVKVNSLSDVRPGENFPASSVETNYFYYVQSSSLGDKFKRNNRISISGISTDGIKGQLAYNYDLKIDDGLPLTGKVVVDGTITEGVGESEIAYNHNSILIRNAQAANTSACLVYPDGMTYESLQSSQQLYLVQYNEGGTGCNLISGLSVSSEEQVENTELPTLNCDGGDIHNQSCLSFCDKYPNDGSCQAACSNNPDDTLLSYCGEEDDSAPEEVIECLAINTRTSESGWATWSKTRAGITGVSGTCESPANNRGGVAPQRDCNSDGTWGGISNPCVQVLAQCDIQNTALSSANWSVFMEGMINSGATHTGSCTSGYDIADGSSPTATCNNGTWENVSSCIQVLAQCDFQSTDLSNANWDVSVADMADSGFFYTGSCASGYDTSDGSAPTATCNDGTWENVSSCIQAPVQCVIQSTDLSDANWDVSTAGMIDDGETHTGACASGYVTSDGSSPTAACNSGEWSAVVNCILAPSTSCSPSEIDVSSKNWSTATVQATETENGSSFEGTCADGYGVGGDAAVKPTILCTDAVWGEAVACEEIATQGSDCTEDTVVYFGGDRYGLLSEIPLVCGDANVNLGEEIICIDTYLDDLGEEQTDSFGLLCDNTDGNEKVFKAYKKTK